jgi:2'-hydroxyisoflavone reductase
MTTNRRAFLKTAAATTAAMAAAGSAFAARRGDEPKPGAAPVGQPEAASTAKAGTPLKILILGGTAFLGPELVEAAKARGHTITLFNRGKTRPNLFPDLEKLHGDRDPKKGEGLKALEGRKWDAVIDTSGYYPRMVKASAELLAPSVGQYVYISSISAYKDNSKPDSDETAEVGKLADETVEEMGADQSNYGPLKALCEQAAEKAMPGKVTNIRPGYIVGPGDWSGRFNYWPLRIEKGGEVLAPGTPEDPTQVIDVRDLAEWCIHCVEAKVVGLYNACGPKDKLAWGTVLETCKSVTKSDPPAKFTWVDVKFLEKNQKPGDYFPIWISPLAEGGSMAGFHRWSNKRAVEKGLKFRPLDETVRDLLKWYKGLSAEQQKKFLTGVSAEREAELLEKWHAEHG